MEALLGAYGSIADDVVPSPSPTATSDLSKKRKVDDISSLSENAPPLKVPRLDLDSTLSLSNFFLDKAAGAFLTLIKS